MMKIYRLSCFITVSADTIVEAKDYLEAVEIAASREVVFSGLG